MNNELLLYHTDNDGFGARLAFQTFYPHSESLSYKEFEYGDPLPEGVQHFDHIIFCDVICNLEELRPYVESGKRVTIIDHHASLFNRLEGNYSHWLDNYTNFEYVYSPHRSGCALAYRYCVRDVANASIKTPELFAYIEDRDLWKWEFADSQAVNYGLDSVPKTAEEWEQYLFDVEPLYKFGVAVVQHIQATCELIARQTIAIDGDEGIGLCNCTSHWSEVGNYIANELGYETAFLYYYRSDGSRKWSIRGKNARLYAEVYGGGGHEEAAGFLDSSFASPEEIVEECLYEARV